jgi:MFS family permease
MWGFLATTAAVEFTRGALFISLLPAYLTQGLSMSVAALGVVVSAQYLADTLFKIPTGWLVDRFGPWRVLAPLLVVSAVAVYFIPRVHSEFAFLALAVAFGAGSSANWPAVLSGSVQLGGMENRASATSTVFLAWLAGGGMGPVLINFLVTRSFHTAFVVVDVIATGAPVVALVGLAYAIRTRRALPRPAPPVGEGVTAVLVNVRRAAWLIPGMFVQMLALGIVLPVMVPFARQVLGLSQSQYGLMLLAGGAVTVLCLIPMGRVVDRMGSKPLLVLGFLLAASAMGLLAVAHGEADLIWRAGLLGFSYALILPAWNGLTVGKIDSGQRGLLLGVFMAIEGLGIAVGPLLGGTLYTWHVRAPFLVTGAILAAIAVFYAAVANHHFHAGEGIDGHAT